MRSFCSLPVEASAMAADFALAWVLAVPAALTFWPAGLADSLPRTRFPPPAHWKASDCTESPHNTLHAPSSLQHTLFCTVLAHGVHVAALVHDSTFGHDRVGLRSAILEGWLGDSEGPPSDSVTPLRAGLVDLGVRGSFG